ncbi:hypothetical protein [Kitasatospora paracochleata]|uniref:Uncharacterized protein n=1 Tax=Kitasatospora paracochleata TaxID=58354 RepID=A0ABT1J9J5_9ACTN|nr:hypothetical protein [Kitasatospora paracochleata]MCP2314043.1 hypothetical protein [Kitasatospora paracochleata]
MSQTNTAATQSSRRAAEQGTHFYVLTLQKPTQNGMATGTTSGTHTPPAHWTVQDFLAAARADLEHSQPELRGGVVVHFDVRPNQL